MKHIVVYFDHTCSYSYTVGRWLRQVETLGTEVASQWRPFALDEANRNPEQVGPFWEQATARQSVAGATFVARQAAAQQGEDLYERFRFLLQAAIHADHLDPRQSAVLAQLAARLPVTLYALHRANRISPRLSTDIIEV